MTKKTRSRIGEKSRTPGGFPAEIVGFTPRRGYDVRIDDGHGTVRHGVQYEAFRDGRVASPYDRTAYGTGWMGDGPYTCANAKRAHGAWTSMLAACRGPDAPRRVCGEWLDFQAFAAWYEPRCRGRSLVLNLSLSGSDRYGPDTCVLIPPELVNSAPKQPSKSRRIHHMGRGRGKEALPQGVRGTSGGMYAAVLCLGGRLSEIGTYGTPEEARSAYLSAKADALEAHAARIDADMSDEGREAVARCCARLRAEAAAPSGGARAGPGGRPCGT